MDNITKATQTKTTAMNLLISMAQAQTATSDRLIAYATMYKARGTDQAFLQFIREGLGIPITDPNPIYKNIDEFIADCTARTVAAQADVVFPAGRYLPEFSLRTFPTDAAAANYINNQFPAQFSENTLLNDLLNKIENIGE